MQERRKFPRFRLSVQVRWQRYSGDAGAAPQNKGRVKNISAGGVCLVLQEGIEVGDVLAIEIELPGGKNILAKGRVIWIDKNVKIGEAEKVGYEGGVEFFDINKQTRKELDRFLFDLSRA